MIHSGIIGPGLIWQKTHRSILAELHETITVVAAAARSEGNQQAAREAYPDATIYSDAQELITDPQVEAVIILTPIALNAPMAQAVLAAGKQAIVEKPLARTLAEARNLYTTAASSAGNVFVLEQHVYKALIPAVRAAIDAGTIGRPVSFERTLHVRLAAENDQTGGYGSTSWRIKPDFPLGNFFDGGIHEVALMRELFGPATGVFARGTALRPDFGEVDLLSMVVEYPEGVHGTFSHSAYLGHQGDSFVIHGTEAALVVRDRELHVRSSRDGTESLVPFEWYPESTAMWKEILESVGNGTTARYSRDKVLADLGFMEAVGRSIKSSRLEPVVI